MDECQTQLADEGMPRRCGWRHHEMLNEEWSVAARALEDVLISSTKKRMMKMRKTLVMTESKE